MARSIFNQKVLTPINIEGTFVNGVPNGESKIELQTGDSVIVASNKGVPHGLIKIYDVTGILIAVRLVKHGLMEDPCWRKVRKSWVFGTKCDGNFDFIRGSKIVVVNDFRRGVKLKGYFGTNDVPQ